MRAHDELQSNQGTVSDHFLLEPWPEGKQFLAPPLLPTGYLPRTMCMVMAVLRILRQKIIYFLQKTKEQRWRMAYGAWKPQHRFDFNYKITFRAEVKSLSNEAYFFFHPHSKLNCQKGLWQEISGLNEFKDFSFCFIMILYFLKKKMKTLNQVNSVRQWCRRHLANFSDLVHPLFLPESWRHSTRPQWKACSSTCTSTCQGLPSCQKPIHPRTYGIN